MQNGEAPGARDRAGLAPGIQASAGPDSDGLPFNAFTVSSSGVSDASDRRASIVATVRLRASPKLEVKMLTHSQLAGGLLGCERPNHSSNTRDRNGGCQKAFLGLCSRRRMMVVSLPTVQPALSVTSINTGRAFKSSPNVNLENHGAS